MSQRIYNTLTQKKEDFVPLVPGVVGIYLCGPTVYSFVHVGNVLGPVFFNFVRNFLERSGFKVKLVYNYTDVDDRIIKASNDEGISAKALADKYIAEFEVDFNSLKLRKADVNPRVTEHMPEIIDTIQSIIANGQGYTVDGEVFYSIETKKDYGKLSHKNIEDLVAGARVEIGVKKKNPLDFSLWKPAKVGEPSWDSPWGKGRPGWHIECSAMAKKHLGTTFDIHGGGIDLIFPHHENEIAQSESANQAPFVNYWMHNNFINFGKAKMSKSLGNLMTARQFVTHYNGEVLKYLLLSSHYRSPSDFSDAAISHCISALARIYSALAKADKIVKQNAEKFKPTGLGPFLDPNGFGVRLDEFWKKVDSAGQDDFNTPEILAEVFNLVRGFNNIYKPGQKVTAETVNTSALFIERVTGLGKLLSMFCDTPAGFLVELDDLLLREKNLERAAIEEKVAERQKARAMKNYPESDRLRKELAELGIEVRDTPEGCEWEVMK